jgi:hypothetical protein
VEIFAEAIPGGWSAVEAALTLALLAANSRRVSNRPDN